MHKTEKKNSIINFIYKTQYCVSRSNILFGSQTLTGYSRGNSHVSDLKQIVLINMKKMDFASC